MPKAGTASELFRKARVECIGGSSPSRVSIRERHSCFQCTNVTEGEHHKSGRMTAHKSVQGLIQPSVRAGFVIMNSSL